MNHPTSRPVALVVNDDPIQRTILVELLDKAGIEARAHTGVEEALAALDPAQPPGLVVSDLYMPGIDGWQFCRLLRSPEYAAFNEVPILVVSATFAGDHPARIAAEIGADAFLPAPVDGKEFVGQARALLAGEEARHRPRALIVEDDENLARLLQSILGAHGYRADAAPTAREAAAAFAGSPYDVAVLDYRLRDGTGDALLDAFRGQRPECVCVMMTGEPTPELALSWMKRGAAAYLRKPFDAEFLIELCARARRERALLRVEHLLEVRTRELRESEEKYRRAFMEMHEGFALHEVICDAAGRPCDYRYLEVNPAFERATGIPREQWIGRTVREVLPSVEDYWIQSFGEVALTGKASTFENYVRAWDQHFEVLAYSPRRGQFAVVVLNVSRRKQRELALQRRGALLEAASRASGLLLAAKTPDDVLDELVRLLGEASGQDRAYYFAWRADAPAGKTTISLRHEWVREGVAPQRDNPVLQELPFDLVAPYSCERLGRGLEVCALVRDLPASEREVLEPQQIISLLLVPIMVNGVPEGFLGFDNCRTEYVWTAEERAALAVVAANLGAARVRSRAEGALRESEARFRELADQLPEIIFEMDARHRLTFANRRAFEQFGYTPEELAGGLDPLHMLVPEERLRARGILARLWQGEDIGVQEYTGLRKDGTTFPLLLHNRAVFREGVPVGFRGVAMDITERHRADEALRRSEVRAARQRWAIAELVLDKAFVGGETSRAHQRVVEALATTLGVARASLWTLAEDNAALVCVSLYEVNPGPPRRGAPLKAADFPRYFEALRSEHRIYAEDAQRDPRTRALAESYLKPLGITSLLDAGVILEGRLAGVVCCEHIGTRRKWHPDEESFASTVAALVAQLFLIAKRQRAEEERERALALLQSALAQSPAGILIADAPHVTIRWANAAALAIRGETSLPLTGIEVSRHARHWLTFRTDGRPYPSEELPLSRAVLQGEITRSEEVIIRDAAGEDRWVSVNAAPIRNPGGTSPAASRCSRTSPPLNARRRPCAWTRSAWRCCWRCTP